MMNAIASDWVLLGFRLVRMIMSFLLDSQLQHKLFQNTAGDHRRGLLDVFYCIYFVSDRANINSGSLSVVYLLTHTLALQELAQLKIKVRALMKSPKTVAKASMSIPKRARKSKAGQ